MTKDASSINILSTDDSSNTPTEFDIIVTSNETKYRFSGRVVNQDTFSLKIINENYTLRWSEDFSANYIDDLTTKAGCIKRISVFWKMLTEIAEGESHTASIDILSPIEVNNLRRNSAKTTKSSAQSLDSAKITPEENNAKIYVIVTQNSEYDCFKYPLSLKAVPFTYEEYAQTIQLLYNDNLKLHKSLIASDCTQVVISLENKVAEFTAMFTEMKKRKDQQIKNLKRKVKMLQGNKASAFAALSAPAHSKK